MKTTWIERGLLLAAIGFSWYSWTMKQEADRQRVIASENYAAALDSVRHVQVGKDSAALVSLTQMAVHLKGTLGQLAKAEGLNARLHARLAITTRAVDTVLVGVVPPVADSAGRLVDSIQVVGPPISGTIAAAFQPLVRSRWDIRLQPNPIPLTVTVGCRKGLPPQLIVTGPPWATVEPSGVLDPSICHPENGEDRWDFGLFAGWGGTVWRNKKKEVKFVSGPTVGLGATWRPF